MLTSTQRYWNVSALVGGFGVRTLLDVKMVAIWEPVVANANGPVTIVAQELIRFRASSRLAARTLANTDIRLIFGAIDRSVREKTPFRTIEEKC